MIKKEVIIQVSKNKQYKVTVIINHPPSPEALARAKETLWKICEKNESAKSEIE